MRIARCEDVGFKKCLMMAVLAISVACQSGLSMFQDASQRSDPNRERNNDIN